MRRLFLGLLVAVTSCTADAPDASPGTTETATTAPAATPTTTALSTTSAAPTTTVAPTQTEALLQAVTAVRADRPVRVGLVAHRASELPAGRTIDVLHDADGVELVRIFAPEHGLAGTADAGELVDDGFETQTGVEVLSLYGSRRSPDDADLADLDLIVYDLQDVGVRAYTYIATLGLVMDAAAIAEVPVLVIDRPNPQGSLVNGPTLKSGLESFISPYPIPLSYGLSSGELAKFLVGEDLVELTEVAVVGPTAELAEPWIPPSPNLPTLKSTWLYPAVVAFEATVLSEGRGTETPFSLIGGPGVDVAAVMTSNGGRQLLGLDIIPTEFTPQDIPNMAVNPRFEGQTIPGIKLTTSGPLADPLRVTVELLDAFMDASADRSAIIDRPDVFDRLVGDPAVRIALIGDLPPSEIAELWADDVQDFASLTKAYRVN